MIRKILNRLSLLLRLNIPAYLHLNYFANNVVRTDRSRIIPYRHSVIELPDSAQIILGGGDLEIGCESVKGSRAETYVRLRDGAVWSAYGGCKISYGATVEVLSGALLDSGYFTMNSGSSIVAADKITLGKDVMIARNVVVYDSDFHSILSETGETVNQPRPVVLGDHVWLGTNVMVLKGSKIGKNTVIGAGTLVSSFIPANVICSSEHKLRIRENPGGWDRKRPE